MTSNKPRVLRSFMSKLSTKIKVNCIVIGSFFLLSSCFNTSTTEAAVIIESLADSNYDLCNTSPLPDRQQLTNAQCFAFQKTGDRVVGIIYTPHKGDPICMEGTIDDNKVVGRAFEILYGYSSDPTTDPSLLDRLAESPRSTQFGRPKIQILDVNRSEMEEGSSEYSALVSYENAVLDLGSYEIWEENVSSLYWLGGRLENRQVQAGCRNFIWQDNWQDDRPIESEQTLKNKDTIASEPAALQLIIDGRASTERNTPSAADVALLEREVMPVAQQIWEIEQQTPGCENTFGIVDFTTGYFTDTEVEQKAFLYQYCNTGHNFAKNGIAIVRGDRVVAHAVYSGSWDNAIASLPDINRNGLSEIVVRTGGTNMGIGWRTINLIELSATGVVPLGQAKIYQNPCGFDPQKQSSAYALYVRPGENPVFYRDVYESTCIENWVRTQSQQPIELDRNNITYQWIVP